MFIILHFAFIQFQVIIFSYINIFIFLYAATAKSLQSCLTLCDPIDGSPLGSSVPGILQARILEWVAISYSNAWKWKMKAESLSRARLVATPWTAAYQPPLSVGFSRQEYRSGLPLPSPISLYTHFYINIWYCHPAYLTYRQSTSWEMLGWMNTSWNQDFQEKYQ